MKTTQEIYSAIISTGRRAVPTFDEVTRDNRAVVKAALAEVEIRY